MTLNALCAGLLVAVTSAGMAQELSRPRAGRHMLWTAKRADHEARSDRPLNAKWGGMNGSPDTLFFFFTDGIDGCHRRDEILGRAAASARSSCSAKKRRGVRR
jgi:hypothetical protein